MRICPLNDQTSRSANNPLSLLPSHVAKTLEIGLLFAFGFDVDVGNKFRLGGCTELDLSVNVYE